MQAISRQTQRAPGGAPVYCERHRPERTALYRRVQQRAATFFAHAEDSADANRPQFVKDEFDAFLKCEILAHGCLRLRCCDGGHDRLVAFRDSRQATPEELRIPAAPPTLYGSQRSSTPVPFNPALVT